MEMKGEEKEKTYGGHPQSNTTSCGKELATKANVEAGMPIPFL